MWWWRARQHKYTICGSNFIIARGTTSWLPISLQCPLPGQFIFIKNVEAEPRKNLLYSVFRWGGGDNRRRLVHLSWLSRTFIHWPATVVDWGKAAKHSVIANRRRWLTSVDSEHWKARPPPTTDYRLTLPIKWTARLASLMQFHRVNLLWRCTLLSPRPTLRSGASDLISIVLPVPAKCTVRDYVWDEKQQVDSFDINLMFYREFQEKAIISWLSLIGNWSVGSVRSWRSVVSGWKSCDEIKAPGQEVKRVGICF